MSTVEYKLKAPPTSTQPFDWQNDPFYKSSIVLGIDIGIKYIGVWLRLGPNPVYYKTFEYFLPKAGALKKRRQARALRHCRKNQKQRDYRLRLFCLKYGLPTKPFETENHEPFKLRLDAVTPGKGLKSGEALVVCLRHIIRLRGFDYHLMEDEEATFPWGDDLDADKAIGWAEVAPCPAEYAQVLREIVEQAEWKPRKNKQGELVDKKLVFEKALAGAVARCTPQYIPDILRENLTKAPKHARPKARDQKLPRELVKAHLAEVWNGLWRNRPFPKGDQTRDQALVELIGRVNPKTGMFDRIDENCIIDYHRKTAKQRLAHAEKKRKDCIYSTWPELGINRKQKCDSAGNRDIRAFHLLEFLAARELQCRKLGSGDYVRIKADLELVESLLEYVRKDAEETQKKRDAKGKLLPITRTGKPELKKKFRALCKRLKVELLPSTRPKKDKETIEYSRANDAYFTQLKDLVQPKLSKLNQRASMCAESAKSLFKMATGNDSTYAPLVIKQNLQPYFKFKLDPVSGFGIYPQVEFLLGRRNKQNKVVVPGVLRRIFTELKKAGRLEKEIPDYVVVEVIRHAPKTQKERDEIAEENRERRKSKNEILYRYARFGLNSKSGDDKIKRAFLHYQQGGKDGKAICPYTGELLPGNPLDPKLEIDHIYPREWGGISEMLNLALTTHDINKNRKGCKTPWQAFRSSWAEVQDAVSKMDWNPQKKELLLNQEMDEASPPKWENFTRQAQIARQLREEVIHWLGFKTISDDTLRNNTIAKYIGTPSGNLTSICRESWSGKLPEFMRGKKDRYNLRNHLYDAAVLSYVPPGAGLNRRLYGGIFEDKFDARGNWIGMKVADDYQSVCLDLAQFESTHQSECLVAAPRQSKSKQARFDTTIYNSPFVKIKKLADGIERRITRKLERENQIARYKHKTKSLNETDLAAEVRKQAFVEFNQCFRNPDFTERVYSESELPSEAVSAWFNSDRTAALKYGTLSPITHLRTRLWVREKVTDLAKTALKDKKRNAHDVFIEYFRKADIGNEELPEDKIKNWLDVFNAENTTNDDANDCNGLPAEPLRVHGTPIHSIPTLALKVGQPHSRSIHKNRKGEDIGCKIGGEVNWRLELWETRDSNGKRILQKRVIPHPRSLALLRSQGIRWQDTFPGENISWREKFCGKLEKYSKPVKIKDAAGLEHPAFFRKGDVLRVPLNLNGNICGRDELTPETKYYWYQVTKILSAKRIGMELLEFNAPKEPTEKEIESGKRRPLNDAEKWLVKIRTQDPQDTGLLLHILEVTHAYDQSPHPVK